MLQAIIDAIVDLAMPVRQAYNKARKELQIDAMTSPDIRTSRKLHIFGEEIDMLQNLVKPIVHLVNALRDHQSEPNLHDPAPAATSSLAPPDYTANENIKPGHKPEHRGLTQTRRGGSPLLSRTISDIARATGRSSQAVIAKNPVSMTSIAISPTAHVYFGDVLDHCITLIQALEQMDASANNISTLIFNTVGARTNNFMMVLAVVTVFFAPLTVVSGYFGVSAVQQYMKRFN
jgi:Mg2+ and Co2+ transporter CorA